MVVRAHVRLNCPSSSGEDYIYISFCFMRQQLDPTGKTETERSTGPGCDSVNDPLCDPRGVRAEE